MSAFEALLLQAHALGAQFALQKGDRLLVQAPAPLPAELMAELRQHKPAIVAAFKERCGWCQSHQLWNPETERIYCNDCHAVFNARRGGWSPGDSPFRRPATHAEVDTMQHL
jgi:hypothetical protein